MNNLYDKYHVRYLLPTWMLGYLINGDADSITAEEQDEIDAWVERQIADNDYDHFLVQATIGDKGFYHHHDYDGKAADCQYVAVSCYNRQRKFRKFEVVGPYADHGQYFSFHGAHAFGADVVYWGCGANAKEAYEDAVDQASQIYDVKRLPLRPKGFTKRQTVGHLAGREAARNEEWHVYVALVIHH